MPHLTYAIIITLSGSCARLNTVTDIFEEAKAKSALNLHVNDCAMGAYFQLNEKKYAWHLFRASKRPLLNCLEENNIVSIDLHGLLSETETFSR